MKVFSEITLNNFAFWSGGKYNADRLTYEEKEQIEYMLEDIYGDGIEDVMINDLFWFDFEIVCEWLGYRYDVNKDEIIRDYNEDEIEEE